MAYYPKAARKLLPENSTQSRINPRAVCLHTAVSNGNSLYAFWTSPSSDGVESHFYLQKSGGWEQYMDTTRRADCQRDGNSFCISVESWDGYPHGWDNGSDVPAWNTAQVDALVDFLVWCHETHDIPLRISRYWNDSGIAWHRKYIGSPGFASSARACPGDRRVAQIPGIIAAAKRRLEGEDDMTLDEMFDTKVIPNKNEPGGEQAGKLSLAQFCTNVEATQDEHSREIDVLNQKLDKVIDLLQQSR